MRYLSVASVVLPLELLNVFTFNLVPMSTLEVLSEFRFEESQLLGQGPL